MAKQTRAQTSDAIRRYGSIRTLETSVIETETQSQRTNNFLVTIKDLWLWLLELYPSSSHIIPMVGLVMNEAATEINQWGRVNTPGVDSVKSIESPSWWSTMSLSNANRSGSFQVKKMTRCSFLLHHCKPTVSFFDSAGQNMNIDCMAGARLCFLLQSAVYLPGRCCCLCGRATFK